MTRWIDDDPVPPAQIGYLDSDRDAPDPPAPRWVMVLTYLCLTALMVAVTMALVIRVLTWGGVL